MTVQWFPGHMQKALRAMKENLKLVDCILELSDARAPLSGRNPELLKLAEGKPRLLLLNKADLADSRVTEEWIRYFKDKGETVIPLNSVTGSGVQKIVPALDVLLAEKKERLAQRGIVGRSVRLMTVGIPNVGKSSFINKFTKNAATKTGDRPGVTRGSQWVRLKNGYELMDTPGVLWPKFEEKENALRLAATGAIRDEVLNTEEIAEFLLGYLANRYPDALEARYKIAQQAPPEEGWLYLVGKKRGFIISGGEVDMLRAASVVLDEFRGGKLGRISMEFPQPEGETVDEK